MSSWYAVKVRLPCCECGESTIVDGPWSSLRCAHCGAEASIAFLWPAVISRARESTARGTFQHAYVLDTSKPIAGYQFSFARGLAPRCSACDESLDVASIADGTDGSMRCTCGTLHDTFPAPAALVRLGMRQVFLGVRETHQGVAPAPVAARPVMFACTNCGGALEITTETRRILGCKYCEVDLFLPSALWNQLHPIRKRRAFWFRGK